MSMHYQVKLATNAISQIQEILSYISSILMAPQTAAAWADLLEDKISSLDVMPERFPFIDIEPFFVFRIIIDFNFKIFFKFLVHFTCINT